MGKIKLSKEEYLDRVRACWLGKNIGGTLGTPVEGRKYTHAFTFYDWEQTRKWVEMYKQGKKDFSWSPGEPLPNDDLDFQLVWVKMLEDRGVNPTFKDFTDYWLKHLYRHWYAEYSFCTYNLQRGLRPPISGAFQNYFVDEMGSPIRSEVWACVAPADPQLAAGLAWMDSSLDHTGGEGRWGEMFCAAMESAAFVIKDPWTLINIGLSMIPIHSSIARSVKEAVWCYENNIEWGEARERIATIFGHVQPCNAIPNHGFIVIGLLYGKDFGDKICKAVNCGFDTDCTGATLGSLLGIMYGTSGIPEEWKKPVGDAITPCVQTVTEGLPKTITELTERTGKIAEKLLKERSDISEIAEKTSLPQNLASLMFRNDKVRSLFTFDNHCGVENIDGIEVAFHYGGEPVLYPNIEKVFEISVKKERKFIEPEIEIRGPEEWSISKPVKENNKSKFSILAEKVENRNTVEIALKLEGKTRKVNFTILGPGGIKGIPAATSAPQG